MAQTYCLKCRAHRDMVKTEARTLKNGRPGVAGECPKCGARMFRIGRGS